MKIFKVVYFNQEIVLNIFGKGREIIKMNSDFANQIKYLPDRFLPNSILTKDKNTINIEVIGRIDMFSKNVISDRKGYLVEMVNAILDIGFNVAFLTPMGDTDLMLKRNGYRIFWTDDDNIFGESVKILFFTPYMRTLKSIISGIVGRENDEYVFGFHTENKEPIAHTFSKIGDNYDICYEKMQNTLDRVWNLEDKKSHTLTEEGKSIKKMYQKGFLNKFLPITEEKNYFDEWYESNEGVD